MYGRELARHLEEGQRPLGIRGGLDHAIHIAAQLGYDRRWIREQLENAPHIVARIREHYLSANENSVRQMLDDMAEAHAQRSSLYGWWNENINNPIERYHREQRTQQRLRYGHELDQQASLSNSPHEDQEETKEPEEPMAKRHHGAIEEGGASEPAQPGLDTIHAKGPIWTHFPNTQRTLLRYHMTLHQADQTAFLAHKTPFGNTELTTATDLNAGGGGTQTLSTTDSLAVQAGTVAGYDFNTPYLIQLRMTSPYNIVKSLGTLNSGGSVSEPNWISFFDSKYQYYVNNTTDWGIKLNFGAPRLTTSGQSGICGFPQDHKLKVFWRYTNQDDPPTAWAYTTSRLANVGVMSDNTTNSTTGQLANDSGTTTNSTTASGVAYPMGSDDYERMHGWKMKEISFSTTHATEVRLHGHYKLGQCKMDIKTLMTTDAHGGQSNPTAEGMTLTRATPQFPEILSMIIVNDQATTPIGGITVPFSMTFDTHHQVDWCDLHAAYKFPGPQLATAGSSGTGYSDEQFFWRGAAYS